MEKGPEFYEQEKSNPDSQLKYDYIHELNRVAAMLVRGDYDIITNFIQRCQEKGISLDQQKVEEQREKINQLDELVRAINAILARAKSGKTLVGREKLSLVRLVKEAYQVIYGLEGEKEYEAKFLLTLNSHQEVAAAKRHSPSQSEE